MKKRSLLTIIYILTPVLVGFILAKLGVEDMVPWNSGEPVVLTFIIGQVIGFFILLFFSYVFFSPTFINQRLVKLIPIYLLMAFLSPIIIGIYAFAFIAFG